MIQQQFVAFQFSGVTTVKPLKSKSQLVSIHGTPSVSNVMVLMASQEAEAIRIYDAELKNIKGWCNGCIPTSKGGSK